MDDRLRGVNQPGQERSRNIIRNQQVRDQRDLILVSATVSDLAYAQSESDFLLEPRRLTVAVSRPKRKLIVLASQALFTLMPADLDDYERGALWKQVRHACASPPLWTGEFGGYQLRVLTIQAP